jgi:hypothetical protein
MTTSQAWQLAYDSGDMYELRNTCGSEASEVEIYALQVMIDFGNVDPVKVASIAAGQPITLGLRPIWGTVTPQLRIEWTAEGSRHEFTINLSRR